MMNDSSKFINNKRKSTSLQNEERRRTEELCIRLTRKPGVHSVNAMKAAGFTYTNVGDATRCDTCELEVSGWTLDMDPFKIHSERSSDCEFVRSMQSSISCFLPRSTALIRTAADSSEEEKLSKRQKTESVSEKIYSNALMEVDMFKQVRRRTFSHWPHLISPSREQMIEAGFFSCNDGDRTICLYCYLICQQWTPYTDDPCEVHKTLKPHCPFVLSVLVDHGATPSLIVNQNIASGLSSVAATSDQSSCNSAYTEVSQRQESFARWSTKPPPSIKDLVRAGFFYTGTKTIVTCFYCNGSLQNWGPKNDPTVEHARWFPHCAYAKQLCGDDLYRQIQKSARAAQGCARAAESTNTGMSSTQKLLIPDQETLSQIVADRLDLPSTQSLLNRNFTLSVIKRCWEDQLRLKQEDFATDCDLFTACTILQKQIEHTDNGRVNALIPSVLMRSIREREQAEALASTSSAPVPVVPTSPSA